MAWWMLVSTWCCFRYDDHRGLSPSGIQMVGNAAEFTLDRSKTTGPDKPVAFRYGVISKGAYFKKPDWLVTGLALWQTTAPFARDYFLCRAGDAGGCMPVELGYVEYSARMRQIISGLRMGAEDDMLGDELAMCHSPHSFRAFLPPALKATGAPEGEMAWLSAWQTKGSATYVRTGRHRTIQLQNRVADIAIAQEGKGDPIGERDTLDAITIALQHRGTTDEDKARIMQLLEFYTETDAETPTWASWEGASAPKATTRFGQAADSSSSASASSAQPPMSKSPSSRAKEANVHTDNKASNEGAETGEQVIEGHVISISIKTKIRTLHFLGSCFRIPGVHYRHYEVVGNRIPEQHEYESRCRACWKEGKLP